MGKRFKTAMPKPDGPRTLGLGAKRRLNEGDPWLRVWSQELTVPLAEIARKTGIDMDHLILIEREKAEPDREEFEAIARAMGTDAETIEGFLE